MSIYIYRGPHSAGTLPDGRDVILIPGQAIELPDDNEWVQTLVALGHLIPQPTAPKAGTGKTKSIKGD